MVALIILFVFLKRLKTTKAASAASAARVVKVAGGIDRPPASRSWDLRVAVIERRGEAVWGQWVAILSFVKSCLLGIKLHTTKRSIRKK